MFVLVALSLVAAQPAVGGTGMFVGAAEDQARSIDPVRAKSRMDLAARAGLGTVRMTTTWTPGTHTVGNEELAVLRNAATAARFDGVRLILSIYHRDHRTTPLTARARGEFAEYAASIARAVPEIRDFIVGNEPNLNLFWMPQFGAGGSDLAAGAYERLLAKTYDVLKSVSPEINVIGGAVSPRGQDRQRSRRQTHSPTTFIADLGAAYRTSGRKRPIMDMFAIHPYVIPSRLPPETTHATTTTISVADYPKLVALLKRAFRGTAQPGATLPIVYDEFGYQSTIPAAKRRLYSKLGAPAAQDAIPEAQQARYYRRALALAQCQPTVAGMLIFHVADERDARAWQSGVYYADSTPKTSMAPVRAAALAADAGTLARCRSAKTTRPLVEVTFHEPGAATDSPAPLLVDVTCDSLCRYRVDVIDLHGGDVAAYADGEALGGTQVVIPTDDLAAGTYQYALRAFARGRPGTAVTRTSRAFTIEQPPAPTPPAEDDDGDEETAPPPPPPPPLPLLIRTPLYPPLPDLPTLLPTAPPARPAAGS